MREADDLLRDVGARIAELRRQRGLTQEALSQRLQVTAKYVQRVEQGSENLTLRTLAHVAGELGVMPLQLLLPATSQRPTRAGRPSRAQPVAAYKRVAPRPGARQVVPLYTLVAAAGEEGRADLAEVAEWLELPDDKLERGAFVLRVRGDSMEPSIPDGSLVLFRVALSHPDGKIVLVEVAPDGTLPHYLLKKLRLARREATSEDSGPRAELVSLNPRYPARRVELTAGSGVRLVGEMVRVLGPTPA